MLAFGDAATAGFDADVFEGPARVFERERGALDAFMPVTVGSEYFPKIVDQLRYYSQDKVLFRFVRAP